ncbi:MAG: flotillin family protein, partial [Mastigocoleus sp. MO_167.B18]|nr:flotillin family protein [Mastigocoleus sp. MO_167.B18]
MLFWLTFIESLPLPPTNTLVGEQYNISDDTSTSLTLIAEKPVETSPYIAQISTQPILNQIDEGFVFPGLIAGIIVLILLSIWS